MSTILQSIGYVKAIQRGIGSDVAEALFKGELHEDSAEFRAVQLIYEYVTNLRYLMQLAEDEDWIQIIAAQTGKPPGDPMKGQGGPS